MRLYCIHMSVSERHALETVEVQQETIESKIGIAFYKCIKKNHFYFILFSQKNTDVAIDTHYY